jgi:hypothetical protein
MKSSRIVGRGKVGEGEGRFDRDAILSGMISRRWVGQ